MDKDMAKYVVIQEWMLDLGLNNTELIAYALINGFCQDEESDFHGSVSYVANWCNVNTRRARVILRSLEEKGLVERSERLGQTSSYTISKQGAALYNRGDADNRGGRHSTTGGGRHSTTADNIVVDKIEDNKDSSYSRARELSTAYGEYVRMTPQEYDKLVERFGILDASRLCEILDSYLAKKPNAYKNHYRAILGWPVQRLQEEKLTAERMKNAQQRAAGPQAAPVGNYAGLAELEARRKAIEDKYKL